jgi:hypothetical protein
MNTLEDLQKRAALLSQARDKLAALLTTLQAEIDTVKQGSLPAIRRAARQIAQQHNELADLIAANPELFVKPRTYVTDGLKFGLQKKKGVMSWDDDDRLCERIRKLEGAGDISAEQAELCIRTKEAPVAAALEKLDARLIKRLGITVAADSDAPLIKSVDGEVEKAVNAVIREATRDANAEVATP